MSLPLRRTARAAVEAIACRAGATTLSRRIHRHGIAILAYHNVVEQESAGFGDASLHLPVSEFIAQIERLAQTHDIVDLEDATERPPGNRPRAVITFDDAYRGAVRHALPVLRRRGLPATVFVAPGLLGASATWWDAIAARGRLTGAIRNRALADLGGRDADVRRELLPPGGSQQLPDDYRIATDHELRDHCGDGICVGSHTWGHEFLPALDDSAVGDTLVRSLEWVNAWSGPTCRWLALPYGGGDDRISRIAADAGYLGVLRIEGGLWGDPAQRLHVPRINVPAGMTVRGLEMRTSGLLP